jgi:hypothetical protein
VTLVDKVGGMAMTNSDLIERFERQAWVGEFHHADHIRLAYAYLSQYPLLEAIERFTSALKRYASGQGKSGLYHETISFAYLFLIHERMARTGEQTWNEFAASHPDLFAPNNGILARYYRDTTLESDFSRSVFLFPDRMC